MAAVLLIACGDGKRETPHTKLLFGTSVLTAAFAQGGHLTPVSVTVTVDPVPAQLVWVAVVQDAPVFKDLSLSILGANQFAAVLTPDCLLPPAVYRGLLTVHLCLDQQCGSELSLEGNQVAYEVSVAPGTVVSVKVDGVAQPGLWASCSSPRTPQVKTGQRVEATANAPVRWVTGVAYGAGYPTLLDEARTSTTWAATLGSEVPCGEGGLLGAIDVNASTDESGFDVVLDVICGR